MKVSFIGAGKVASNLGKLFTDAGHHIMYGSRNVVAGRTTIAQAIKLGDIIFLAVPYQAVGSIISEHGELLKGKIVVDVINPVNLPDWSPLFLGEDSSGEQTARLLPESRIVKAFNPIFADLMVAEKLSYKGIKTANFIATDDVDAGQIVKTLSDDAGFDSFVIKGIQNARYLEGLANLNISLALQGGGANAGFIYFQR